MSKVELKQVLAPIPETERGRPCNIKTDPKGQHLIYCVANSVIIRDMNDFSKSEEITHHAKKVTSAAFAPSGNYVCSGDITGTVKIWDFLGEEKAVKYEYRVLAGPISDIAWTADSKRIVVVGDGKEKFAHAFAWDTGTSVGTVAGHGKRQLSVDVRQQRPMKVATAGEEFLVCLYQGPPFKYVSTIQDHSNFVNSVRFSPDGAYMATCGQEGKVFLYQVTESGDISVVCEMVDVKGKAHQGGVYGLSWCADSKQFVTASADKTCKVWSVETKACKTTFTLGNTMHDQQLGCVWSPSGPIISVSLSGKLSFLDQATPEKPVRTIWGHNKGVICSCLSADRKSLFSGSFDGALNAWDLATGECVPLADSKIKSQVSSIDIVNDCLACCGFDDKVFFASVSERKFNSTSPVPMPSQPQKIVLLKEKLGLVLCLSQLVLVSDSAVICTYPLKYKAEAITVHRTPRADGSYLVAMGGQNSKVQFLTCDGKTLKDESSLTEVDTKDNVTYLEFCPAGKRLSITTAVKSHLIYCCDEKKVIDKWSVHGQRVTKSSWRDEVYTATCGVDGNIYLYSKDEHYFSVEKRNAHKGYSIPFIHWADTNTLITVAQQSYTFKLWNVSIK